MILVEERAKIVNEEDKKFCTRFWKVMPFFYNEDIIKGAYPGFENEDISLLKNYIPHVREMYKGLVAPGLEKLRTEVVKAYENNLEAHRHPLEIFKPHLFERNKIDQYKTYLNKAEGLDLINDKLIIDQKISEYKNEASLPLDSIYDNYWSKHSEKYIDYLDGLLNQFVSNKEKVCDGKKMIAVIAAMNETELEKVYSAIKNAYGDKFEKEVLVFFFHNFKDANAIPTEVQVSIDEVKQMGSNVLVVESEVPNYFNTAPAKKTCNDLVLKIVGAHLDIPIALIDADVFQLTNGVFQAGIDALSIETILAASPEFDYDQNLNIDYPVLNLIFDIRRDLDVFAVREEPNYNEQMTYGMCTIIQSRTLLTVGGTKPTTWEDGFLTNDIRNYSGALVQNDKWVFQFNKYPIYHLSINSFFVYINSAREKEAIFNGDEPFCRWSDGFIHDFVSVKKRELYQKELNKNNDLYINIIPENICKALNKAWLFMFRFRPTDEVEITDKEIRHSKRLVRLLAEKGIYIKSALVQQKIESPYDLEKNEGDFFIRRIDEIIIKPNKI